jgi:hypothetical protein
MGAKDIRFGAVSKRLSFFHPGAVSCFAYPGNYRPSIFKKTNTTNASPKLPLRIHVKNAQPAAATGAIMATVSTIENSCG